MSTAAPQIRIPATYMRGGTSKCVILSKSTQPGHDVDYLYGQVSIDKAFVDWSGNCGNLSAAVGPFAITNGLIGRLHIAMDRPGSHTYGARS